MIFGITAIPTGGREPVCARPTLESELLARCRFKTQPEARSAIFAFIEGFYNYSSHRTSRYVVEENRFCCAASGKAGVLGWVLARTARSRAAVLWRSAR